MTLVELLGIIVFVGILIGLFFPLPRHNGRVQRVVRARFEMAALVQAVKAYEIDYNGWPLVDSITNADVSCGMGSTPLGDSKIADGTRFVPTNSDLIVVLMDLDLGVNAGHKLNPKKFGYLAAKRVRGASSPGVSDDDHQYRDPWGNPYVISLDANHDGFVRDGFYSRAGLYKTGGVGPLTNRGGIYELSGSVMVWSRGPDGKASSDVQADKGVNKDNLVSWR